VPEPKKDKKPTSMVSIVIWVVVGGVAVYYLATGIMGIIAKG